MGEMSDGYLKELSIGGAPRPQLLPRGNGKRHQDREHGSSSQPRLGRRCGEHDADQEHRLGRAQRGTERGCQRKRRPPDTSTTASSPSSSPSSAARAPSPIRRRRARVLPRAVVPQGLWGARDGCELDSLNVMPDHMKALPPIRTKSMDAGSARRRRGNPAIRGSPASRQRGSPVTGLTPHGMLMGTGLTPRGTGLTPLG